VFSPGRLFEGPSDGDDIGEIYDLRVGVRLHLSFFFSVCCYGGVGLKQIRSPTSSDFPPPEDACGGLRGRLIAISDFRNKSGSRRGERQGETRLRADNHEDNIKVQISLKTRRIAPLAFASH
jgi:hypothetical protein